LKAVRTSVDPKVIDCPNPEGGRATIDGVRRRHPGESEGARAVRTNLDRFVGGAKENTIMRAVGEGIGRPLARPKATKRARVAGQHFQDRAGACLELDGRSKSSR